MATSQSDISSSAFNQLISSSSGTTPPEELSYNGQLWRKIDHLENKKKGIKVLIIWSLGQTYAAVNNANKKAWRCNACGSKDHIMLLAGDNALNTAKHLQQKHNLLLTEKITTVVTG